jgi:hypothetical protein
MPVKHTKNTPCSAIALSFFGSMPLEQQRVEDRLGPQILQGVTGGCDNIVGTDNEFVLGRNRQGEAFVL